MWIYVTFQQLQAIPLNVLMYLVVLLLLLCAAHNMLDLLVKRYFTACAVGVKHARRVARMWAASIASRMGKLTRTKLNGKDDEITIWYTHVFDLTSAHSFCSYGVGSVYGLTNQLVYELMWLEWLEWLECWQKRSCTITLNNGYVSFVRFDCVHAFVCHRSCTYAHLFALTVHGDGGSVCLWRCVCVKEVNAKHKIRWKNEMCGTSQKGRKSEIERLRACDETKRKTFPATKICEHNFVSIPTNRWIEAISGICILSATTQAHTINEWANERTIAMPELPTQNEKE